MVLQRPPKGTFFHMLPGMEQLPLDLSSLRTHTGSYVILAAPGPGSGPHRLAERALHEVTHLTVTQWRKMNQ